MKVDNKNGIGNPYHDDNTGEFSTVENAGVNDAKEVMGRIKKSDIKEYTSDYQKNDVYKAQEMLKVSYKNLIDNDTTRINRYKEWAVNSNNDYKEYIYNDLKNGKKEAALNYWYNKYKLLTGQYDLTFEDFLNTPLKLYRATNVGEKEDYKNPFFSYATNKKDAERFLDNFQRLDANRTGEIEEIYIAPIDTLGMFPSDENEIIIPNKKYEEDNKNIESVVDNLIRYANKNNVELPYDKNYIFKLFKKRDLIKRVKLKTDFKNYVDKSKKEENPYEPRQTIDKDNPYEVQEKEDKNNPYL